MEFISRKTDIRIPKLYAYDLRNQNNTGCPFYLLEYIHGNTAEEVSRTYLGDHEGIPTQFEEKFWRQVAKIMTQPASVRLPKMGSGPYNSAAEFYADYPFALSKSLGEQPVSGQEELVQAFQALATSFTPTDLTSACAGFGLANYDLNPNNVLVDREFNVLAVIDWNSVVAVPDAALYRFPFLMGVGYAVPGDNDTHPAVLKRHELGRRFAETVERVGLENMEGSTGRINGHVVLTKARVFSKEATAFRSLVHVKMKQDWVNGKWLKCLKWLSEHNEPDVAEFEHGVQRVYLE
ncbi:hypothetical protein B0H63DRAFT_516690 [Podospora didyma]|uniref:Aminoglycoside phosphotransferase domain-containing protein n=1 Tax=Podospora didyma TaxID=330526 RepID=A0AAE0U7P6_9PEZI|nr:hypothetical protein B0H63DRAFT_516690 [Podospora didyma]